MSAATHAYVIHIYALGSLMHVCVHVLLTPVPQNKTGTDESIMGNSRRGIIHFPKLWSPHVRRATAAAVIYYKIA